ncbi:hypothetical protein KCG52_01120 [Neisseria subflava]|uniref:hypothetical protein n=1 Tax=Neisseria subflava TaxID=28449 RepID=UPI0020B70D92|nr:hypothetical protein [Neisseria subflava]UTG67953.1 hypothetical protein KCG52_01120 [Neisseria subflava]
MDISNVIYYEHENQKFAYKANPTHRTNHNQDKSQWLISLDQEYNMFKEVVQNKWFTNPIDNGKFFGYGIFLPQEKEATPICIGKKQAASGSKDLYIARFDVDLNMWHGYPCGDKQSDFFILKNFREILQKWINAKYITKAQFFSKIHKGKSL